MFHDTQIELLDSLDLTTVKTIYGDMQPYIKSIPFEDGYTLEATHRAFCDIVPDLQNSRYVRIDDNIFIIMDLKEWSDYQELFLYRCNPDFASGVSE